MNTGNITLQFSKKNTVGFNATSERIVMIIAVSVKKTIKSNNKNKNLIDFFPCF